MNERWIDGDIKPTRLGAYEVRFANPAKVMRSSWDGRVWRHCVLPPNGERSAFFWREASTGGKS